MVIDPVNVRGNNYRVIRGAPQGFGSARGHQRGGGHPDGMLYNSSIYGGRDGLRLSLSLPCNGDRVVVQQTQEAS